MKYVLCVKFQEWDLQILPRIMMRTNNLETLLQILLKKLSRCKGRSKLKNNKKGGTIQMGIDIVNKPCNNLLVVTLRKHGLKFQYA